MNKKLYTVENSIKTIIADQVSEIIIKVKDSVIEALNLDKLKMQKKRLKLNTTQIRDMYPDFIFKEKLSRK